MSMVCSVTESGGSSRNTLSRVSAVRCSGGRVSGCCSLCGAGARRGRSCALANVAVPASSSASSRRHERRRASLVILGKVIAGVIMRRPGSIGPSGAPRRPHHIGIGPLLKPRSAVDNRLEIRACRAFPAFRRAMRITSQVPENAVSQGLARARTFHGARSDTGALRPDLRAPACRLGRQRDQDRVTARARWGEPLGGPREGSDFQNLHRNKRSMTLNLKAPEAVAAFKRMVKKADVVVENFRPDVKRRLGIDYPQLRKINPKLVYASISGFGQTGPYAARPGFDQIAQGMGGLMSITGLPGQGPVRVGIPIADLTAGLFCALGILVALLEREKSKQGQHVTTSLLQAQIFMLDFQGARWLIEGDVPKQAGNNHPTSIPTGVFKTADGHINIASTGSKIWARFCAAADASELLQRPEYQTAAERSKNRDALNADIERYTVKQTSAEWIERLNKAGVPCGPSYSVDQVYADPQVEHLGIAQAVKTRDKSKLRMAGQPMSLSRTPSRLVARPPKLGEHTDAVLKEFGFSAKDIAALRKANAV